MESRTISFAGLALALLGSCASESQTLKPDEPASAGGSRPYRPGQTPVSLGNERDEDVKVQLERGTLNQPDIDELMDQNAPRLMECYDRAGEARKYASGEVGLRFLISRTGAVTDVMVVRSQLGNYPVERCLVVEGRKIPFPQPGGDKATDFEWTIRFKATGEARVVEWAPEAIRNTVAPKMRTLAPCGPPSEREVRAVAYIQPSGVVVSVGLESPGRIDIMNAMCVVEQIRKWRLPGESGHLVRTSFLVHGRAASAQVLTPPPGRRKRPVRRSLR